jgi:hypothetical protein
MQPFVAARTMTTETAPLVIRLALKGHSPSGNYEPKIILRMR